MPTRLDNAIQSVRDDPTLARAQLEGPSPTPALAEYIANSQSATIPPDILELGKRHILDTLASLLVSAQLKPACLARDFARFHGGSGSEATLLTTEEKTSLLDAIFANAMTAHAAEINDFCPSAFVQPGPPILSILMGIGETLHTSGDRVLRALVTGYEVACRVPKALGINNLRDGGLSNHGVGPVFGGAAAAASLLGIPQQKIPDMLAYCVQQTSGSFNWMRDEEHVEKAFLFAGMPARNGATAALLVHHGFTGNPDALDGSPGFLQSTKFVGLDSDMDRNRLIDGLGSDFQMPLVAYKRYPVGGPTQPSMEAMLKLVKEIDPTQVKHIEIKMPGKAHIFAAAKMPALSLPYLCSVILEDGKLDFNQAQSHERFISPSIRDKMTRVEVLYDASQERDPRSESALVTLTLNDGSQVSHFVEHVLGYPTRPMSHDDVESKARELIVPVMGEKRAQQLIDAVWNIEELGDICDLVPLLKL
ncbi:MAG: 2-methylcitrate dehydratase [Gammaproteobacteria bacterium]|jgi:2-methylcitrate dehydratase PrpD|nr:2-methylcitrate dehydratase [Gammaproteobacteria bacterium]